MKTFESLDPFFEIYNGSGLSTYSMLKFINDKNTYCITINLKVRMKPLEVFEFLRAYIQSDAKFNFTRDAFFLASDTRFITVSYDTFGKGVNSAGMYYVTMHDIDVHSLKTDKEDIETKLKAKTINSIVWSMMAPNGDTINKEMDISTKYNEAFIEFYPWIKTPTLENYFDDYLASEENILLLIGAPGTGKTTFIKNLLIQKKLNAVITYDEKLMKDDSFFLDFITGDKDILIIEDADTMIQDRDSLREDNTIMSKILNVSDGIVKNVDKKIVFSTNITDKNRIDSALMRPGRCFDTIDFRKLDIDEATAVLKIKNIDKQLDTSTKKLFTLAEVLSGRDQHTNKHKVGF